MKILVTGGRKYDDARLLSTTLDLLHRRFGLTEAGHEDADGADALAHHWALANGFTPPRGTATLETTQARSGTVRCCASFARTWLSGSPAAAEVYSNCVHEKWVDRSGDAHRFTRLNGFRVRNASGGLLDVTSTKTGAHGNACEVLDLAIDTGSLIWRGQST